MKIRIARMLLNSAERPYLSRYPKSLGDRSDTRPSSRLRFTVRHAHNRFVTVHVYVYSGVWIYDMIFYKPQKQYQLQKRLSGGQK